MVTMLTRETMVKIVSMVTVLQWLQRILDTIVSLATRVTIANSFNDYFG